MKIESASNIEGLGVSPAKSYGHVLGTDARFFGQGLVQLPTFEQEQYPFQTFIRKTVSGGYEYLTREGMVDNKNVTGTERWQRIDDGDSVFVEATISNYSVQSAKLSKGTPTGPGWAVGDMSTGADQKLARKVIASFYTDQNSMPVVTQNVKNHLYSSAGCYKATAAMVLG